jgi:uncharacterized protein
MSKEMYAIKRSATGLGMFAQQIIPKNTRILKYVGTLVTNEESDKSKGRYIIQLNETHALNGKQRTNLARYINHSCKPNAEAYTSGKQVWIWSKKDIKAGEEITMDYGKEYFDDFIKPFGCKCKKCSHK